MQPKNRRKRRYAAPIGGMFILLAALGVITVIYLSLSLTVRVLDNDQEKRMFENVVMPVVMFNPTPFETPSDIENDDLLNYSMWAALLGDRNDTFKLGENQELLVPARELNAAAAKLFGPNLTLEHHSFDYFDLSYYYDETISSYNVPGSVVFNVYKPLVETVTRNGEYYELNVGFMPTGVSWQTDFSGGGEGNTQPEKYMIFVMQKTNDGYRIAKVQDPATSIYNQQLPAEYPDAELETGQDEQEPEQADPPEQLGQ